MADIVTADSGGSDDALSLLGNVWRFVKYFRRSVTVRTRAELDAALIRAPRFIIIEGTEALRAYAASLAYRGGQEAALLETTGTKRSSTPTYMVVPTVGRIRDGYRQRVPERRRSRGRRSRFQPGIGPLVAAIGALFAALLVEFLMWPASDPELIRGPHHVTTPMRRGVVAKLPTHAPLPPPPTFWDQVYHVVVPVLWAATAVGLIYLAWQAVGTWRSRRVSWRVDYRIQGRLVIARVTTRIA